jgi:hypothetical protein
MISREKESGNNGAYGDGPPAVPNDISLDGYDGLIRYEG